MITARSQLLLTGILALLIAFLPALAKEGLQEAKSETIDLGNGLHIFRYGTQQSIFLIGSDGVIVTDPLSNEAAGKYHEAINSLTNKPVVYLAYSSSFFDRVAGGETFMKDKPEVIAQENCKINLEATPHPDIVMPDTTYSESTAISAGDVSLELYYFGQSYGTCLSVMIAKPANIMLVLQLVTPPAAKLPDDPTLANYYLHNLLPFFVYVEELAANQGIEQVVGSIEVAGAPPLASAAIITDQRVFWDTLLRIVEQEYNKGTPAQVIPRKADMSALSEYSGYDPQQIQIMMRRVYSLYRIGR